MEVQIGKIYKHYKGNLYIVENIATHTETNEDMVIYRALYGDCKVYARPLKMFIEKIENQNQEHRFELQNIDSKVIK